MLCSPEQKIGETWITHLDELTKLKPLVDDANFVRTVQKVKQENKMRVAQMLTRQYETEVNPASMFDIQVRVVTELGPGDGDRWCGG